jgi:hypothetical protein
MKCIGEYASIFETSLKAGEKALEVGAAMASIPISAVPFIGDGSQRAIFRVVEWITKAILGPLIQYASIIAVYFGVIIPSLPYAIFIVVVVAWILEVALAIVATPLWAVMLMTPERYFIGSQKQGVLMMLSLFVRPSLAIIGLFLAIIISDPIITFTAKAFFNMRGAVMGSNDSLIGIVAEFTTFHWWLMAYGTVLMPILYMVFGLSQTMPDRVLKWVGAGTPDLGETNAMGDVRGGGQRIAATAQERSIRNLAAANKPLPGGGDPGKGNPSDGGGDSNNPSGGGGNRSNLPVNSNNQGLAPSAAEPPPNLAGGGNSPPPKPNSGVSFAGGGVGGYVGGALGMAIGAGAVAVRNIAKGQPGQIGSDLKGGWQNVRGDSGKDKS